jgi:hypothetical protein
MEKVIKDESLSKRIFISWFKGNLAGEIISSLLIILFVYTALNKLLNHQDFRFQLGKSPLTTNIADILFWSLPVAEFIISFLLLSKKTRLFGLYLSFYLLIVFTGYIYSTLHYSYDIPCSCGGVLQSLSWDQHIIFNLFFMLLSIIGILVEQKGNKKQSKNNISEYNFGK